MSDDRQKAFELTRTVDPDTIAMLQARRDARADTRLNTSMKACFDEIADRAFNPASYDAKGIVTISDTALAEIFGVSNRTVYSWKHQIAQCGYVWLGQKYRSNMWPMTTYYLTCIHKKYSAGKTDSDGTYGGRKLRSAPLNPGQGARAQGQPLLPLAGSRNGNGHTNGHDLLAISAEARNGLPPSPEENCGPEPNTVAGESRNELRPRAEENCGPEPKQTAGESRNGTPARAETDCRLNKDKVKGSGSLKGVGSPPQERSEWEKRLKKMFPRELESLRAELLKQRAPLQLNSPEAHEVTERIGAVEIALFGGKVPKKPAKNGAIATAHTRVKEACAMSDEQMLTAAIQTINAAKASGIKPLLTDRQLVLVKQSGMTI